MNSESRGLCEELAKRSGAVLPCPNCGNYDLSADDDEAEGMAYGAATNAWKRLDFGNVDRQEVLTLMKSVLRGTNTSCPSCG